MGHYSNVKWILIRYILHGANEHGWVCWLVVELRPVVRMWDLDLQRSTLRWCLFKGFQPVTEIFETTSENTSLVNRQDRRLNLAPPVRAQTRSASGRSLGGWNSRLVSEEVEDMFGHPFSLGNACEQLIFYYWSMFKWNLVKIKEGAITRKWWL